MKTKVLLVLFFLTSIMYAQIPTSGMKAYYELDNASTTDLLGLANFTQTGTATVATTNRLGSANTAITLNGDSFSRGDISYSSAFNDFSISFWLKTTTNSSDYKTIIYDVNNPSGYAGSSITVGSHAFIRDGKISFRLRYALGSNTGITTTVQSEFIADGNWHHITVVSDQLKATIYTDNVLTEQGSNNNATAFTNRLADPVGDIFIAQDSAGSLTAINQYQDDLDDVIFYDRVLTATEIENIGTNNGFCFPPMDADLSATNTTETTADINWINSGTYDIAYGLASDVFSNYTQINAITANTYSLTNLTASSVYTVYVRKQCSTTQNSDWNTFNFATDGPAYVDVSATGNNDGSSFTNAYTDLQTALTNNPGKEIWIATGTYIPSQTADRDASFDIPENTKLYGGFDGTETSLSQRNAKTNITILSGDLNGNDDGSLVHDNPLYNDNSYQVVTVTTDNVVLDGLTIKGGNANGTKDNGSALAFNESVVTLNVNHVIFEDNRASEAGIIYATNNGIADSFTHNFNFEFCIIRNNIARFATVMYIVNPYTTGTLTTNLSNTLIYGNEVRDTSTATGTNTLFWFRNDVMRSNIANFENCTITKNRFYGTNTQDAGVISASRANSMNGQSQVFIYNTIIWDNLVLGLSEQVSLDQLGTQADPGLVRIKNSLGADGFSNWTNTSNIVNNISSNPLFVDVSTNDFMLQSTSPAIDTGDNSFANTSLDLVGNLRIFNTIVDMGVYEFGSSIPVDRTLTTVAANGTITVDVMPTNGVYSDGTIVVLTATPNAGFQFDGWSGDASGTINPLSVTMDADKSITATFSKIQRTLTLISSSGAIQVSGVPNSITGNSQTRDDGDVITLTALPDTNYQFDGWSGDASGTTNPLSVTMDADKTITANYSLVQHSLTTTAANGSVSANIQPTNGTYDFGTVVQLTATPDIGYQFDGWSGDASGTSNPLNITTDADKSVTANFSLIQQTLTTTAVNGTIVADIQPTNGTYDYGTVVQLTATPDTGYQFDGWSGDATGTINPLSIAMDADKNVTALFSLIPTASVVDNEFNSAISIYPNPVVNSLKVDLSSGQELKSLQVFNLIGKKVFQTNTNTVDFSSISSGIYMIKVESKKGKIAIRKVVKK